MDCVRPADVVEQATGEVDALVAQLAAFTGSVTSASNGGVCP